MNILQRIFRKREPLAIAIENATHTGFVLPLTTDGWTGTQDRRVTRCAWDANQSDRFDLMANWSDGENPRNMLVSVHIDWTDTKAVFVSVNGKRVAILDDAHGLVAFGVPDQVKRAMRSMSMDLNDLERKAGAIAGLMKRQIELVEKGNE